MSAWHVGLSLAAAAGIWFISLSGALLAVIPRERIQRLLPALISLSAGLLLGDAFLHLVPDAIERSHDAAMTGMEAIAGYLIFWITERVLLPVENSGSIESFARMEILADSAHNLVDGLMLGASFVVGLPVGVLATMAIAAHEVPREIGNVGVLVAGGYPFRRAVLINFACGIGAVVGTALALAIGTLDLKHLPALLAAAAGGMIYVASADFLPALRQYAGRTALVVQALALIGGLLVMWLLLLWAH
jgi:zinc and cadmium transporter